MAQNRGLNLDTTDEATLIQLREKRIRVGLQESEKEQLKQLEEKGRIGR